jgi:NitT/TauT family transport system substrate-binding protein
MEGLPMRKLVAVVGLIALACSFAFGADKVTLQIEGSAVPYYLPIFNAIEKGYFAAEGLDVDYMFGNAADIAKNVAVGNVQFGFPNGEPVILARSQGIPVVVVHSTLQHGLGATIFLKDSGISKPADLKGRTVAITSLGSPNYVQLQVLLEQNGLSIKDVKTEIVGTEAIVPALVNKRVDAICFSMLRTFELKSQNIAVDEFRSDAFLPSFGNVVVVGEGYLAKNKAAVQKFVRALDRSMTELSDPSKVKAALLLTMDKHTPTYKGREDYMASIISSVYAGYLWTSDDTKKFKYGYGNADRWQKTADIMQKFGIITQPVKAKDFVVADVLK